jgi:hypothetical protein
LIFERRTFFATLDRVRLGQLFELIDWFGQSIFILLLRFQIIPPKQTSDQQTKRSQMSRSKKVEIQSSIFFQIPINRFIYSLTLRSIRPSSFCINSISLSSLIGSVTMPIYHVSITSRSVVHSPSLSLTLRSLCFDTIMSHDQQRTSSRASGQADNQSLNRKCFQTVPNRFRRRLFGHFFAFFRIPPSPGSSF